MAEPTANTALNTLGAIIEPIGLILGTIFSGIARIHWSWWFSQIIYLISLPVKLILIPLAFFGRVLLTIFAPVLAILSYGWAAVSAVGSFIASLEPLFTFFSVAAIIGIIAGLTLALCSSVITNQLGFQETSRSALRGKAPPRRRRQYLQDNDEDQTYYYSHDNDSSSNEADWQWAESSTPVVRKPAASGLLSQTIHEEDDSSDAAL